MALPLSPTPFTQQHVFLKSKTKKCYLDRQEYLALHILGASSRNGESNKENSSRTFFIDI